MIADALKTREGSIFLASAALVLVLDALLLISTVNTLQHQDEMSEAVGLFYRNEAKAKSTLHGLRDRGATPQVFLAAWYAERAKSEAQLDSAKKLFTEALAVEPGRTSAAVGLAAVILEAAAQKDAAARKAAADEAETALSQALDDQHPDVRSMKGAIALMRGKPQDAVELLSKDPDTVPSLEGEAARKWNLGVAKLLLRQPDAFEALAVGFQLRRWPIPQEFDKRARAKAGQPAPEPAEAEASTPSGPSDGEKLLVAAYRLATADPAVKPNDPEAALKRCEKVERLTKLGFTGGGGMRGGQRGRYLPHAAEMPAIHNALGLGYYRAERYADAARAFGLACGGTNRTEPLYLLNEAQCAYKAGLAAKAGSAERKKLLGQAARAFDSITQLLQKQKGRQQQVQLALTNAVAIYGLMGDWGKARDRMWRYRLIHPSKSEWNRHMGVLWDHNGDRRCVEFYRKAIEAGHPEQGTMQQRIRYWAGRQ